ncbi:hypothetical protein HPB47_020999 [Ixodes persulcatus]|uniref:Uncharacterized protein n=1 Tax=Ixodes persulcatus TaxID=34615 RepID=A0AC60QH22_IXOPE|nr:hypothetical protein HPB47_020999 [Ixodes persulcatus]
MHPQHSTPCPEIARRHQGAPFRARSKRHETRARRPAFPLTWRHRRKAHELPVGKTRPRPPLPSPQRSRAKLAIRGPRATRKREVGAQSAYLKQGHDVRRPQRQSSEGPAGHEHGASASRHSRSQRRGRQRSAPSAAAPVRHAVQRPSRPFAALGSTGRCGTRNRCPATQRRSADAAARTQSPERAPGPKDTPHLSNRSQASS